MNEFIHILQTNFTNITKITFFNYFKTGNAVNDAIISSLALSVCGYVINNIYDLKFITLFMEFIFNFKSFFYTKNTIILEGKNCSTTSGYSYAFSISSSYSKRFKALINHIIENIDDTPSIYQIKETHSNYQSSNDGNKKQNLDIFMVFQQKHFKLCEDIYIKSYIEQEETNNEKEKMTSKIDKITIIIYSYKYSLAYLKKYVDSITERYLNSIKEDRANKRFIYFLEKIKSTDEDSRYDCWKEDVFETSKSFHNIFFDGKNELIEKIDFFNQNRYWYYDKGIPYSLGIGLSGPAGTGKTSFIKALARYTNRHIISISLKLIKTKQQLETFFFENTYNDSNEKNSITFDKKIIVFEDIDCIGDLVLDREKHKKDRKDRKDRKIGKNENNIQSIIQEICKNDNKNSIITSPINTINAEQPITLDDILNLWDGIRETPGRIMIMTSNYYSKLDSALIRPGRIDITHEFSNASRKTISDVYFHLFGKNIDKTKLLKIKEYFYSPAELINIYVSHKDENRYINRLLKNKKC